MSSAKYPGHLPKPTQLILCVQMVDCSEDGTCRARTLWRNHDDTLGSMALPLLTAACAASNDGSAPQIAQGSRVGADADALIPSFTCDNAQAEAAGKADCATQLGAWLDVTSQNSRQQVASCVVALIEVGGQYIVGRYENKGFKEIKELVSTRAYRRNGRQDPGHIHCTLMQIN